MGSSLLPFSLQPVYDVAGNRSFDAVLFVFKAGTTSPAAAYMDAGLNNLHPNPIPLQGNSIFPPTFVADGSYRCRSTDGSGYVNFDVDNIAFATGGSGGDGGGSDVDPNALVRTGDLIKSYCTGTRPGYVRANGRTIGSSSSSASERANDDTVNLFTLLYNQDPNLAVSGGRGSSASSDYPAGKTIALPDAAGRFIAGLDDLGAGPKNRLAGGLFAFGGSSVLGSYGGEAAHTQSLAEMAMHGHAVTATMDAQGLHAHSGNTSTDPGHFHTYGTAGLKNIGGGSQGSGYWNSADVSVNTSTAGAHFHSFTTSTDGTHAHNITASVSSIGNSTPMNWLPPFILLTFYLKL